MIMNKVALFILDGWGYREETEHNAVLLANTPNYDKLVRENKSIFLEASGEAVGLPHGQMGNSEVGHLNIGAGRVVFQELVKINRALESGEFAQLPVLKNIVDHLEKTGGNLHLLGLVSDGGVHSHTQHIKGVAKAFHSLGINNIRMHAFSDGRDTPPQSGREFIQDLDDYMKNNNLGAVATVTGRYFAMDRDKRWERTLKAYNTICHNENVPKFNSVAEGIENQYNKKITDEFLEPFAVNGLGFDTNIKDGDAIFFCNFRTDRGRQLTEMFISENFEHANRGKKLDVRFATMTMYSEDFNLEIAFAKDEYKNIFGEVVANNGLKQLRLAETEKYPHVTFFFNGGREEPYKGEERILVNSPRDVATYDLKPEMSIGEVTNKFCAAFETGELDVAIVNFANPDMVGHTGVEEAVIAALEAVDTSLGKVLQTARDAGATILVTADHGNCELMWDYENNVPHTQHTTNLVRLTLDSRKDNIQLGDNNGKLADIAPTMLQILGIQQPKEMDGNSLLKG